MTDIGFDGKVAIVTGAGNGLGRQYALLLASRGARVVVNDLGGSVTGVGADDGPAAAVVKEIQDRGGDAVADTHSVATPEGGQSIVDTALTAFGRIDVVVNNAGFLRDSPFRDLTPELLDPIIDVHLKGAFHVTRPAWVHMQEHGYGRVVNTTSAAGLLGTAGKSNYGSAKAGLLGLTRILAVEGDPHGIKVNAIAPIAATRMLSQALSSAGADEHRNDVAVEAVRRYTEKLDPALVAPVVAFLAHADCPTSGEIYTVGGGQVARLFVGRTRGYYSSTLSVEDVRDHFGQILDETGYTVPADPGEETRDVFTAIASGGTQAPDHADQTAGDHAVPRRQGLIDV